MRPLKLEPPKNGTVVRIVEFGPEGEWLDKIDAEATRVAWGAIGTGQGFHQPRRPAQASVHAPHAVGRLLRVLEGEITLVLDDEEVLMRQGDFPVERGTNHAWANRSASPCKMLFVLVDGQFDPDIAGHFNDRHG